MNYINNKTFNFYLSHDDKDIKKMAEDLLEAMFDYCAILTKAKSIDFYGGDLDAIKSYDTGRRIKHDFVISGIGKFNRYSKNDGKELLLNTENMTREDIANAVVLYCVPCSNEFESVKDLDKIK